MAEEPAYLRALKSVTRSAIETESELREHEAELYGQNDRATALLFGSLVERSLEDLLRTKMRPETLGSVFGSDGVLGSFGSKITLAYALALIGQISRSDLNIIRNLRNEFAHATKHFSFSTPEVKPTCDALKILDHGPANAMRAVTFWSKDDARMKYLMDENDPKTRFMLTCHDFSYRMLVARGKAVNAFDEPLP